jgi:hypothetical protein
MTREKSIRIHRNRGYQIEELGKMVIISLDNYRATWFFNTDGSVDESNPPIWRLNRSR